MVQMTFAKTELNLYAFGKLCLRSIWLLQWFYRVIDYRLIILNVLRENYKVIIVV